MPTVLLIDSLVRSLQAGIMYALMALGLTLTLAVIRLMQLLNSWFGLDFSFKPAIPWLSLCWTG